MSACTEVVFSFSEDVTPEDVARLQATPGVLSAVDLGERRVSVIVSDMAVFQEQFEIVLPIN